MLMTAAVDHSPVRIPSVADPTPAEQAALVTCGQHLAAGLAASLAELCTASCSCSLVGTPLLDAPWQPAADDLLVWWGQSSLDWRLWLPVAAAEDILAGLLGCCSVRGGRPWSDLDQALLDLQGQKLAEQVSRSLALPLPEHHGLRLPSPGGSLPVAAVTDATMHFDLHLQLQGRGHTLRLITPLDALRPLLPAPLPATGVNEALLAEAMVTLQAVLPGPSLSAGELLGLEPGDIVCLGEGGQEALLQVEGVTVGRGRPGAQAGRLAVSVRGVASSPAGTA